MSTNTAIKKWQERCPYRNPAAATDSQKLDFACIEIAELRAELEAAQPAAQQGDDELPPLPDPFDTLLPERVRVWRVDQMRAYARAAIAQRAGSGEALIERLTHERDALGKAIADSAKKAGIWNGEVGLTGPHLIMFANDLAECVVVQPDSEYVTALSNDKFDQIVFEVADKYRHCEIGHESAENLSAFVGDCLAALTEQQREKGDEK